MNYKNYDINIPEFDSKIKYYFSLFFISIKSYEVLRDTYGEDLNLFKKWSRYWWSFKTNSWYGFSEYIHHLFKKYHLKEADIIRKSGLERTYAYKIIQWRKRKKCKG